ncbi:MAG: cytochrome c [Comamonadaceae bacterium]|nr:cytochrome c [Comamonadaceae bacterium]
MQLLKHLGLPAIAALALIATGACAQSTAEPMALRGVMQQMDHDAQAASAAIERKDWMAVATLASLLARHSEPPMSERMRILGWLLTDATTFRNYDKQVKAAATQLQTAALKADAAESRAAYQRMQQSCDGCHNSFRAKYLDHFYGNKP